MDEKRIFEGFYITDRRYVSLTQAVTGDAIEKMSVTENVTLIPKRTYRKQPVLHLMGRCVPTSVEKEVTFPLPNGCTQNADVFTFACNASLSCNAIGVSFDCGSERVRTEVTFFGERWTRIVLELAALALPQPPGSVTLHFYSTKDASSVAEEILLDEMYFGSILDFSFRKGKALSFLQTEGRLTKQEKGLLWQFSAGQALRFPALDKPEYSVMNMLFSVKESFAITASAMSPMTFGLRFCTDLAPEVWYELPCYIDQTLCCRTVSVQSLSLPEDAKLYQLELVAKEEGALLLLSVTGEQEQDFLLDEDAVQYMQRPSVAVQNPYGFYVDEYTVDVRDFGASGNGFDDDTQAVIRAIRHVSGHGGGRVVLKDGRFRVTHVPLCSDIELHIAPSAILLQSDRPEDYPYPIVCGHDSPYLDVSWAHNFLVSNLPMLYGNNVHNVRITGGGKIRMYDGGNEERLAGFPYFPKHCVSVFHVVPIAFVNSCNVEISDITVNRANSYHVQLTTTRNVFINGCRFFDVRCLSADGIGLGSCKNVLIANTLIVTNDDCVTFSANYADAREGLWYTIPEGEDNSVRNIEVAHCYLNSGYGGGGKAIAFIPWGRCAENQEYQQIDGIYVHDCVLNGGHSVGTWCDTPQHGKQPFDNSETDDYSPVKNVRIFNNDYRAEVTLLTVLVTDLHSDAGLYSAPCVVNGDFAFYLANWNAVGKASVENGVCRLVDAEISQGLQLSAGRHTLLCRAEGEGYLLIGKEAFPFAAHGEEVSFAVCLQASAFVQIGVRAKGELRIYEIKSVSEK